jgi:acetyl-CoA carboxylase biotin carboxyl carrier protein
MKPKEIKKLIELLEQSNVHELEVSRWGKKVRISKSSKATSSSTNSEVVHVSAPSEAVQTLRQQTTVETAKPETKQISENTYEVKSPMVGTFYRSPAPDADPYVQVGDIVSANQVLCIIEAMKLMNEIEAEIRGRVIDILVENAQPVEYNQVLFRIEKL